MALRLILLVLLILNLLTFMAAAVSSGDDHSNYQVLHMNIGTDSKCECAAFPNDFVKQGEPPLLAQNPVNVTCDLVGQQTCHTICNALVKIGKDRAPVVLCSHLIKADNLKPSLFLRICNRDWTYGGVTAQFNICCDEGKHIPCKTDA